MRIEDIKKEFSNMSFDTEDQRRKAANQYKAALLKAGMSEDDVENEIDGWLEVNWTQQDWKDYYGADSDADLDGVMEFD